MKRMSQRRVSQQQPPRAFVLTKDTKFDARQPVFFVQQPNQLNTISSQHLTTDVKGGQSASYILPYLWQKIWKRNDLFMLTRFDATKDVKTLKDSFDVLLPWCELCTEMLHTFHRDSHPGDTVLNLFGHWYDISAQIKSKSAEKYMRIVITPEVTLNTVIREADKKTQSLWQSHLDEKQLDVVVQELVKKINAQRFPADVYQPLIRWEAVTSTRLFLHVVTDFGNTSSVARAIEIRERWTDRDVVRLRDAKWQDRNIPSLTHMLLHSLSTFYWKSNELLDSPIFRNDKLYVFNPAYLNMNESDRERFTEDLDHKKTQFLFYFRSQDGFPVSDVFDVVQDNERDYLFCIALYDSDHSQLTIVHHGEDKAGQVQLFSKWTSDWAESLRGRDAEENTQTTIPAKTWLIKIRNLEVFLVLLLSMNAKTSVSERIAELGRYKITPKDFLASNLWSRLWTSSYNPVYTRSQEFLEDRKSFFPLVKVTQDTKELKLKDRRYFYRGIASCLFELQDNKVLKLSSDRDISIFGQWRNFKREVYMQELFANLFPASMVHHIDSAFFLTPTDDVKVWPKLRQSVTNALDICNRHQGLSVLELKNGITGLILPFIAEDRFSRPESDIKDEDDFWVVTNALTFFVALCLHLRIVHGDLRTANLISTPNQLASNEGWTIHWTKGKGKTGAPHFDFKEQVVSVSGVGTRENVVNISTSRVRVIDFGYSFVSRLNSLDDDQTPLRWLGLTTQPENFNFLSSLNAPFWLLLFHPRYTDSLPAQHPDLFSLFFLLLELAHSLEKQTWPLPSQGSSEAEQYQIKQVGTLLSRYDLISLSKELGTLFLRQLTADDDEGKREWDELTYPIESDISVLLGAVTPVSRETLLEMLYKAIWGPILLQLTASIFTPDQKGRTPYLKLKMYYSKSNSFSAFGQFLEEHKKAYNKLLTLAYDYAQNYLSQVLNIQDLSQHIILPQSVRTFLTNLVTPAVFELHNDYNKLSSVLLASLLDR